MPLNKSTKNEQKNQRHLNVYLPTPPNVQDEGKVSF